MANVEDILKRAKDAESRKHEWRDLLEDTQFYFNTPRENIDNENEISKGQREEGQGVIYDSTPFDSLQKGASNIHSSLTPPNRHWIDFQAGSQVENTADLQKNLGKIKEIMFGALANSNFDTAISESYQDLFIGTGALLVFKGDEQTPFRFVSVPLEQMLLEEGVHGRIDGAFRCFHIAVRNIEKTWEDVELDEELKEMLEEKPSERVELLESTIPDRITITTPEDGTREVDGYRYCVIHKKTKKCIVEREMTSSPWVVFRWSKSSGEVYGRGPAMFALPDAKTLNKTKELLLQSASMNITGMFTAVDDGVIDPEKMVLGPAAIIPVQSNGGPMGPTLQPLQTPSDINLAQIIIQDLVNRINSIMLADPLGPIDLPVKTATEVSLRQQELSKRIGATFGRLQYELITPLVNRLLDILDELGLIDLGGLRVDGSVIAIKPISPLAQAQANEEFSNVLRLMEVMAQTYGPQLVALALPPDKFLKEAAPLLNIKEGFIPTEEEMEQLRAMLQQMMAAQQGAPQA